MSNVDEKQTVLKDAKDLSDISVDKVVHLGSIDKLLGSDHEEKINVNEKEVQQEIKTELMDGADSIAEPHWLTLVKKARADSMAEPPTKKARKKMGPKSKTVVKEESNKDTLKMSANSIFDHDNVHGESNNDTLKRARDVADDDGDELKRSGEVADDSIAKPPATKARKKLGPNLGLGFRTAMLEEDSTICDICGKQFSRRGSMKTHKEQVHIGKIQCEKCLKFYYKGFPRSLSRHLKECNSNSILDHEDGIPIKKEIKSEPMDGAEKVQEESSSDELKRSSDIADDSMDGPPATKARKKMGPKSKTAMDEKESTSCDICGKKFSTKNRIQAHFPRCVKIPGFFDCQKCLKSFTRRRSLFRHLKECNSNSIIDHEEEIPIKKEIKEEIKTEPVDGAEKVQEESNSDELNRSGDVANFTFVQEDGVTIKEEIKQEIKTEPVLDKNIGIEDRKLFVGGLSQETQEPQLKEYFEKYGEVESVALKRDLTTGRSRGFAFIEFKESTSVDKVFEAMYIKNCFKGDHAINNKRVSVKRAKVKPGKIFLGRLKPELSDDVIKNHFQQYGNILEIERPFDKKANVLKNFCFITFEREETMKQLIKKGKETIGRHEIDLKRVTPKQNPTLHQNQIPFPNGSGGGYNNFYGQRGYGNFSYGYGNFGQGGYGNFNHGYQDYGYGGTLF